MILFLNDIAASEVMLIFLFILLFFGSKSIPGIARSLGKTFRQIKEASDDVQREIKKSGVDIKKDMNLKGFVSDTIDEISKPLDQMTDDMDQAMNSRSVNGYNKVQKKVEPQFPNPENEDQSVKDQEESKVKKDEV